MTETALLSNMEEDEEAEFSYDDDEEDGGSDDEPMEFDVGSDDDEDEALQEAFAAGKLKPGTIRLGSSAKDEEEEEAEKKKKKDVGINDVPQLKLQLEKVRLPKKLGWGERLDVVNDVAPLAPEIALQLDDHEAKRSREINLMNNQRRSKKGAQARSKSVSDDPIHNDFVREMGFYRQAQSAVLKCLPRLREMKIPTKRPEDYFAEMAKSDSHMQKVAQVLLKKQTSTEKAEKVRNLRDQKKFAKQTQIKVIQERQKAKKEMIESVKKYRKGMKGNNNNLDFLEERKGGKPGQAKNNKGQGNDKIRVNKRRQSKNDKYGYGGKKKGSKWNTRESLDSFGEGSGGGGRQGSKGGGGGRNGFNNASNRGKPPMAGGKPKRPGKNTRQKIKTRRN